MSTVIDTKESIGQFQLFVVRRAIQMYLNHGIKASRAYTPANMIAFASQFTGKQYKRNGLRQAYLDLCALTDSLPGSEGGEVKCQ